MEIQKHLELLGYKVEDRVTGYRGVVASISFDLYGCVMASVSPRMKDGKVEAGNWFDVIRLIRLSKTPVMDPPNFEYGHVAEGKKGPAEKSAAKI